MKKSKVLIPAFGILVLSTVASITGTVAWFTANSKVSVTGMQVKTKVSNNLQIVGDTIDSTAKKTPSDFTNGPLVQSVKGVLEPVSTVNGTAFYYTTNAKADGDAAAEEYTLYNVATAATDTVNYTNKFSEDYDVTKDGADGLIDGENSAKAYVEYVFQVRAQNTTASITKLGVSKLELVYGGAQDPSKAYRVAFFVEDISSANPAGGVGTLNMIYTVATAANFESGKAVNSTTTLGTVTYNTANTYLDGSIAASSTKQYKVVVRMWLEGEDNTCNSSTFAALTNDWKLNLELKLDAGAAPVSNITKYTKVTAEADTKVYYCDGAYAYNDNDGEIGAKVTSDASSTLKTELDTKFGVALTYPDPAA